MIQEDIELDALKIYILPSKSALIAFQIEERAAILDQNDIQKLILFLQKWINDKEQRNSICDGKNTKTP